MASKRYPIRIWSFRYAPRDLRALFSDGKSPDWVVHVPKTFLPQAESCLLRWQRLYPVRSVEFPDGSAVYWGAPRKAIDLVADKAPTAATLPRVGAERRSGVRVPIEYASSYETHSRLNQTGTGRTIDMSSSGVCFITESLLTKGTKATVRVTWPTYLEGDQTVELVAAGRVTRSEKSKAALKFEKLNFRLLPPQS
jgi:hypothetical protein